MLSEIRLRGIVLGEALPTRAANLVATTTWCVAPARSALPAFSASYPPTPVGYCARSAAHSDGRAVAPSRSASSCL
eukprot:scaffold137217_cov118-Phaeocystis_antarctica.AAC.1